MTDRATRKSHTRRAFIGTAAAAAGALAIPGGAARGAARSGASPGPDGTPRSTDPPKAPQSRRLLILGGTGFIGPHMVRYAVSRGHDVTIFNRGRTNPQLFPEVEKLVGDRDGDLEALCCSRWDAVIDNSGYVPRHVRDSAQLLKDAADFYLFTSTGGVYAHWYTPEGGMKTERGEPDWPAGGTGEDEPTVVLPEPGSEEVGQYYGHLKALCEEEVRTAFGEDRCAVTRPGLIVGPGDTTDRFTYYPVRIDIGGEVMAFGGADDPVQYIDARDLAEWSVHLCEERTSGTYNAIAPLGGMTMAELLYGIRAITSTPSRFTWVPGWFLAEHGVPEFSLPPWSSQDGPFWGATQLLPDRAFANGLTSRPLAETARDTLDWWNSLPRERREAMRAGLRGGDLAFGPASMGAQMQLEAEILEAWKAHGP